MNEEEYKNKQLALANQIKREIKDFALRFVKDKEIRSVFAEAIEELNREEEWHEKFKSLDSVEFYWGGSEPYDKRIGVVKGYHFDPRPYKSGEGLLDIYFIPYKGFKPIIYTATQEIARISKKKGFSPITLREFAEIKEGDSVMCLANHNTSLLPFEVESKKKMAFKAKGNLGYISYKEIVKLVEPTENYEDFRDREVALDKFLKEHTSWNGLWSGLK